MASIDLMGRVVGRPSGWEERRSDAGHAIVEEVAENVEGIELALATRAKQRRQDLLRLRAEPRAIAPETFRFTTAGRSACSARQLVASIVGSYKKLKSAGHSRSRCVANRRTAGTMVGWSRTVAKRACSWPRATATPWAEIVPAACRSLRWSACCNTVCTRYGRGARG